MASPFEGELDLPYFETTFPELSHMRYSCSVTVIIGSKPVTSKLQLVGPFLLLESAPRPLMYLPNYFIRCLNEDRLIELIPASPCLTSHVRLYAESRLSHEELGRRVINARDSVISLPDVTVPFIYACEKCDSESGEFVPLANITIQLSQVEMKGKDRKTSVLVLDSETRITTETSAVNELCCFSIWPTTQSCTTFRMESLDAVLCSVIAVAISLMKFRRLADLSQMCGTSQMSPEFPVEMVRMVSITQPVFQSPWVFAASSFGDLYDPDFSVAPCVPAAASNDLAIVNTGSGSERTVLVRDEHIGLELEATVVVEDELEQEITCKDVLLAMTDPDLPLELPAMDESSHFEFAYECDKAYFSLSGNRLMDRYFQPPFISGEMESEVQRVGLTFKRVHLVPYGQDIVESLDVLIRSMEKQGVDMGSKVFRDVVCQVASILIDGADHHTLKQDLEVIATSMQSSHDVVPRNTTSVFEFVLTLTARLIQCHKLRCFIGTMLICDNVREHLYCDSALMRVPQFIANISASVRQLEKCRFTGKVPDFPRSWRPMQLAHCQVSFLIRRDVDAILSQGRDPVLYETHICTLLHHLQEFLRAGFVLRSKESLWKLFQLVNNISIRDPALSVFKKTINEVESSSHSQWFLVPACLLQGIRASICHHWILHLALASQRNKAHTHDAPINNHDAIAVIYEAMKSLSNTRVATDVSALHYHAHMF